MKSLTLTLLLILAMPAPAFDLATRIVHDGNTTRLETDGYARLMLLKQETAMTGPVVAAGRLSVSGAANIVMWARVDGRYYFSKLPLLQNVSDREDLEFEIPFEAGDKTVTEVLIEVEMLRDGSISIDNLILRGG